VMAVLRSASSTVTSAELESCWPDSPQLGRAISGLLRDGLVELVADDSYQLPA
jgi:hypothetical protein